MSSALLSFVVLSDFECLLVVVTVPFGSPFLTVALALLTPVMSPLGREMRSGTSVSGSGPTVANRSSTSCDKVTSGVTGFALS